MKLDAIRTIVLDIDDTIYLEREYVCSGFRAVGNHLWLKQGIEGFFQTAWELFEQGVRGNTFDLALERLGVSKEDVPIDTLLSIYRDHTPDIRPLPDTSAFLEQARARGVRLAVVSDGPLASQKAKALALGLYEVAQPVLLTSALGEGYGKPHPKAFSVIQTEHGLQAANLVYVADNPLKDFQGPKSLGWQTIRIRRPGGLHTDRPSGADVDGEIALLTEIL